MDNLLIAYAMGLLGVWFFADGVASLYTYTGQNPQAKGQSFWRDHCLRIVRCLLGVALIYLGYLLLTGLPNYFR